MRKRRTREHIIADLPVNHFERMIMAAQSTVDYYDILRRDAFDLLMVRLSRKQPKATSV